MDLGREKELEKTNVVQKCPRCGKLALRYVEGALLCSACGFQQRVGVS